MSTRQDTHDSDRYTQSLLNAVYTISVEISRQPAGDQMLQSICQRLVDTLSADYVLLVRGDPDASDGAVVAEYPARLGRDAPVAQDGFAAYQTVKARHQPVIVRGLDSSDSNYARFRSLDLETLLLVPLLVPDRLTGFLLVGTTQPERRFTDAEQRALQTVAIQLASSLGTAELTADIQHRANQLDQIIAFGRLVTSTLDRRQILQHVSEIVPDLLPVDQLGVALLSSGQGRMHLVTLTSGAPLQEDDLAAAGSGVEEVVQTQTPMLLADLSSSTYTDHARMREQGLRALLIAPLTVSGYTFGAVMTAHQHAARYTPTDLALLQQIGNQIAIALENARQFQATRQRAQQEESLSEIVSHLQQQADLRVMMQQTMQDLGHLLGARRARVRLQVTPGAQPTESSD
jgi:GAF domain-containing protein